MLRCWHITRLEDAESAFSPDGKNDGRWNSEGAPIVDVAGSQALAVLELFAHLRPSDINHNYCLIEASLLPSLVSEIEILPENWATDPPPMQLKKIGDCWVKSNRSVALRVPSVQVPSETNYLLNTRHPDFSRIEIGKPISYRFDPRLVK